MTTPDPLHAAPPTRELSEDEYLATFLPPMVDVSTTAEPIVDAWAYADPVIEAQWHSCEAWDWIVSAVWETRDGAWQHLYIPVPQDETYLLLVVDKPARRIHGHFVLDLRAMMAKREENRARRTTRRSKRRTR